MTLLNAIMLLLVLFNLKHFVVDFLLQRSYQYSNKGTYGHPGGLLHAGLHAIGTWLCLFWVNPFWAAVMGIFDAVVHYHIDWAKTNINSRFGWTATTHEEFWWLLGLDQLLHAITYIVIIGWTVGAF
jgi:hypothetical protein